MGLLNNINVITVILICLFLLPVITGAFRPFTRERITFSISSLFDNLLLIAGIILSIYLVKMVYFEHGTGVFKQIYDWIPQNIKNAFQGRDILVYLFNVPFVLFLLLAVLRFITEPLYRFILIPMSEAIYRGLNSMGNVMRALLGALSQVPRSAFIVFVFALILNFYSYYFSTPVLSKWMNESTVYQLIYNNALNPVLNSNIARKVPVIINDSFRRPEDFIIPGKGTEVVPSLAEQLDKRNIKVIAYFNGVTLDEAIKSTPEIDKTARDIVKNAKNEREKAYLLYKWISQNIKYDYDKAQKISEKPTGISSGSKVAFETRKGICFDYSSLYISMCRATGLKVQLITGMGYSGISWGDHAWNRVYIPEDKSWINVDTTFGVNGNYFDKPDFYVDHRYPEIQGEW